MKHFKDILVYAESDDAECLARVMALAAAHEAAITVCEVVEPPPLARDSRHVVERLSKLATRRAQQRLQTICTHFADEMFIDYAVLTGSPFIAITEKVIEEEFDLVVHISEPIQRGQGIGLNATGMHLMRKCPTTIWALYARTPDIDRPLINANRNVLLALDREVAEDTSSAEAFAITLAETALALARTEGSELHVLHAWRPYGASLLEDTELDLSESDRRFYSQQQRRGSEQWFRQMTQRIESLAPEGVVLHSHLVEGGAVASVHASLLRHDIGTLILGTVGTSANPGVLIGPTTESILAACGTAMMTLKPPGFVSPLQLGVSR